MLEQATEILGIVLWSALKFAVSAPVAFYADYSFWETVLMTAVGGVAGVYAFYYSAGWLMHRAFKRKLKRSLQNKKPQKTFSRKNKMIVRIKKGSGIKGIAIIMPPILGIPIGAVLAAKYFYGQPRTLPLLVGSTIVWAFLLSSFWQLFGI